MKRLGALKPAFDFSVAPQPVGLAQGHMALGSLQDEQGEVLLQLLPKPQIVMKAKFKSTSEGFLEWGWESETKPEFFWNGKRIEGFSAGWRQDASGFEWYWAPSFLPLDVGDMQAQTTVAAVAHIFNFPDFRGGQHQESAAPEGRALLLLECDDWRITVQSLSGSTTHDACKLIRERGGCFLTHVAQLERMDGAAFSGEMAKDRFHLLSQFLSFVLGSGCTAVCPVGFDISMQRVWQAYAAPRISKNVPSWFHKLRADQAEQLFPLFAKRYEQSQEWKSCLEHAIYWYAQANTDGSSIHVQTGIILVQAALERLAYHYTVIERKMISKDGFEKLRASDQLRMLFAALDLQIGLDGITPDLQKVFKTTDRAQALTDVRNSLVHPKKGLYEIGCYIDAWKLGLWYLELSLLALCRYEGVYDDRLRPARYPAELRKVPWLSAQSAI